MSASARPRARLRHRAGVVARHHAGPAGRRSARAGPARGGLVAGGAPGCPARCAPGPHRPTPRRSGRPVAGGGGRPRPRRPPASPPCQRGAGIGPRPHGLAATGSSVSTRRSPCCSPSATWTALAPRRVGLIGTRRATALGRDDRPAVRHRTGGRWRRGGVGAGVPVSTPPRTTGPSSPAAPRRWPWWVPGSTCPTPRPTPSCGTAVAGSGLMLGEHPLGVAPAGRTTSRCAIASLAALSELVVVVESHAPRRRPHHRRPGRAGPRARCRCRARVAAQPGRRRRQPAAAGRGHTQSSTALDVLIAARPDGRARPWPDGPQVPDAVRATGAGSSWAKVRPSTRWLLGPMAGSIRWSPPSTCSTSGVSSRPIGPDIGRARCVARGGDGDTVRVVAGRFDDFEQSAHGRVGQHRRGVPAATCGASSSGPSGRAAPDPEPVDRLLLRRYLGLPGHQHGRPHHHRPQGVGPAPLLRLARAHGRARRRPEPLAVGAPRRPAGCPACSGPTSSTVLLDDPAGGRRRRPRGRSASATTPCSSCSTARGCASASCAASTVDAVEPTTGIGHRVGQGRQAAPGADHAAPRRRGGAAAGWRRGRVRSGRSRPPVTPCS